MKLTACLLTAVILSLVACNTDPVAVSKKYAASAQKYYTRGQYKEASILYRRALSKNLRSAEAWYGLGFVNLKINELSEARKDFVRAMELDPANQNAAVQLGNLDLAFYFLDPRGGRAYLADLKDIADGLLKKDSHSFDGLRFSGNIALAANDTSAAIQKFQQANAVRPDQPDLMLTLVETLFAARRNQEGEKLAGDFLDRRKAFGPLYDTLYAHYMRANQPQAAEQILQRQIAANPQQSACLIQLAFHYFVLHRAADVRAVIGRLTSDAKDFPNARLDAGDFYVRVRDYPAALAEYEAGQQQNSKLAVQYQKRIAELLASEGEREKAEKMVAGLLKNNSKDTEAQALHAALLLASGDPRQVNAAIAELEPLITKLPRSATVRFNLGRAYMLSANDRRDGSELERAREQFQAALRIDPHHASSKLALAEIALKRGQPAEAAQVSAEIVNEDPTNAAARLMGATALVKMGERQEARAQLTALLQNDPNANDARAELAELDFTEHRYPNAEDGFRALFRSGDPRGAAGFLKTEIAQGKVQPAVEFAADQVKRAPNRSDTRLLLAQTLEQAGKFSAAAAQLQVLIDIHANSPALYRQLGEAKMRAGDDRGAMAALQTAQQLAPNDAGAMLDTAMLYDRTERWQQARKEYERVIELQPDNVVALNNLAYLEADRGIDLDQALAHAQRAQQKMPDNLDVQDTLALVYIRKNLTNDGIRMLRELVARKPDSSPFHLHLALALYQKGDRPSAKRELRAALQHQPSPQDEAKIKELLAKVG